MVVYLNVNVKQNGIVFLWNLSPYVSKGETSVAHAFIDEIDDNFINYVDSEIERANEYVSKLFFQKDFSLKDIKKLKKGFLQNIEFNIREYQANAVR